MKSKLVVMMKYLMVYILIELSIRYLDLLKNWNITFLFNLIAIFFIIIAYNNWYGYNQEKRNKTIFDLKESFTINLSFFSFILFIKIFIFRDLIFS